MDNLHIIVLASGVGKRFGTKKPKQLLKIGGKPLLYYSLKTALSLNPKETILTYPTNYRKIFENILKTYNLKVTLVEGGDRRQDSVKNALEHIKNDGVVLIHDSARPLASTNLFVRVYKSAIKYGNVIPVIPIADTIKEVENNYVLKTLDREKLFLSQTPQGFRISVLKKAIKSIGNDFFYTDEANLLEQLGEKIYTIEGERYNLKLTFKEDLDIIKFLIGLYESKGRFRS